MPLRPKASVCRYMSCQRNSVSKGSRADEQRLQIEIDRLFGQPRGQRGIADADEPGIGEDLDNQPAMKTEAGHGIAVQLRAGPRRWCKSEAAERTVLPRHSTTRVRISVIFI